MNSRVVIQIDGTNSVNKGAELMLESILNELFRRFENPYVIYNDLCFEDNSNDNPFTNATRVHVPLFQRPCLNKAMNLFHVKGILAKIGISFYHRVLWHPRKVDYLLDASGFYYSDNWNFTDNQISLYTNYLKRMSEMGAKIVYLPQAFGPFEKKSTQQIISSILQYASLIYVRDDISYSYFKKSRISIDKLKLSGDFTILLKADLNPSIYDKYTNCVCIIPNSKMITHGKLTKDRYISFVKDVIEICQEEGRNSFLLNHEGWGDEILCKEIANCTGQEVVTGLSAKEIKDIISKTYLVISSRFHGVASALNCSVPCLSTSWSHKYQMLFDKYRQDDCVLDINSNNYKRQINKMLSEDTNMKVRSDLLSIHPSIVEEVEKMWDEVFAL